MNLYHFAVAGQPPFSCEAESKIAAMFAANAHYGPLPQGAWIESIAKPGEFYWAQGNFFD
jgi:hypothetical protein